MSRIIFEEALRYKRAAAVVAALLTALTLGMLVGVGPTGAQTCPPGEQCEPPNRPPTVDADSDSVVAVQDQTATNTGTYSDDDSAGDVTITASVGNVTKTGTDSGTWSWSLANVPLGRQRVTITATDSQGADRSTSFTVTGTLANGKIAFASNRDGNYEIYTMNPNGSGVTRLTNNPATDLHPAFSPDGTKIAFMRDPDEGGNNTLGNSEIYVMNTNGTELTRLTDNSFDDEGPAFSPDGSQIVFSRDEGIADGNIYTMNANGTGQTRLTSDGFLDDQDPAYSPDGSQIVFMRIDRGPFSDNRSDEIYVMNADGTSQINLTNNATAEDYDPTYGPEGKIVFTSDRDGDHEIYTMSAFGSGVTRLTNNTTWDRDATVSPDGRRIAFTSNPNVGNAEVYTMNADGTGPTNLTNSSATVEFDPSWGGASDTEPPQTTITSAPPSLANSRQASFTFSSETNSTFECSLDGGAYETCNSPKDYANLSDGQHTFLVRATDAVGNVDASPASHVWTVDATAPTIENVNPADGATSIRRNTNVTATFLEAMDPKTLVTAPTDSANPNVGTSTTFQLFKGGATSTAPVPATVTLSEDGKTVTLDPSVRLAKRKTYTVKIVGAKDKTGNTLPDEIWSFKTGRR